jgi:23S rRNA U2552 (ribose-2'-O)-methylase RlmE/FtsJ
MSKKTLDFKYAPIIVKIQRGEKDSIFSEDPNINFSSNVDYPRSEFGFHHFIHASKNKLDVLKQFENKKKVYLINNQFEPHVENDPNEIEKTTEQKFSINNINRNFYKLWEILSIFGLSDNSSSMTTAHLGESTGGFVQAMCMYRDDLAKKSSKNDKYYVETESIKNANKSTIDSIKSKITSQKSITDNKCDLITSDVNVNIQNLNIYEQQALNQILDQIITMTELLKKGGSFVCKFYETFTMTSIKMITILSDLFENVYFIKPLISELSDTEKFAVCVGYKQDKKASSALKIIQKELKSKPEKMNVTDLFENYDIPRKTLISIINLNCVVSNYQFKSINAIVNFIKKEVYFGEEFHDKTAEQFECSKYWTQMFYSSKTYPNLVETMVKESDIVTKNIDDFLVVNI